MLDFIQYHRYIWYLRYNVLKNNHGTPVCWLQIGILVLPSLLSEINIFENSMFVKFARIAPRTTNENAVRTVVKIIITATDDRFFGREVVGKFEFVYDVMHIENSWALLIDCGPQGVRRRHVKTKPDDARCDNLFLIFISFAMLA